MYCSVYLDCIFNIWPKAMSIIKKSNNLFSNIVSAHFVPKVAM